MTQLITTANNYSSRPMGDIKPQCVIWYLLFTFNVALEIASPASFVATHCTVPLSPDWRLVNLSSFLLFIWTRPTFDGATFCPLWYQVIWGFGGPVALHLNTTESWGYLSAITGCTVKVGFSKEQGNYIDKVIKHDWNNDSTFKGNRVHMGGSIDYMCIKYFICFFIKDLPFV